MTGNLVRAEWRRLFTRRLTQIMMLLVVVVLALVVAAVADRSHRHTPASLAQAKAFIAGQRAQNLEQCRIEAQTGTVEPGHNQPLTAADCQQMADRFHPSVNQFQGYQFTFHTEAGQFLFLFGGLLALFGFVVGASFVGAEWSTGSMSLLLIWRPDRVRLWLGKLAALQLGVGTFAALASLAWLGGLWTVAHLRGDPTHITSGLLASLAWSDARALALALACAAAAFAIASYGRHTAAALGAAVGYIVVFEVVLRIVLSASGVSRPQRFYLTSYVFAWLAKSVSYPDANSCSTGAFGCRPASWSIGMSQAAALIGAIVIAVVVAALAAVRRRDVI